MEIRVLYCIIIIVLLLLGFPFICIITNTVYYGLYFGFGCLVAIVIGAITDYTGLLTKFWNKKL